MYAGAARAEATFAQQRPASSDLAQSPEYQFVGTLREPLLSMAALSARIIPITIIVFMRSRLD